MTRKSPGKHFVRLHVSASPGRPEQGYRGLAVNDEPRSTMSMKAVLEMVHSESAWTIWPQGTPQFQLKCLDGSEWLQRRSSIGPRIPPTLASSLTSAASEPSGCRSTREDHASHGPVGVRCSQI